jgi:SHAQKYF class myb-like DNA-binding protein
MTISRSVYNQLFEQAPDASGGPQEKVIRLRPTEAKAGAVVMSAKSKIQMWTKEEHDRFLAALEKFPAGPWKKVADFIGTKTPRQTMTHAQKYRQKIHRRQRGLRNQKKSNSTSTVNPIASANASAAATAAAATGANPTPVDTKADMKGEPSTIVSPYGVADLQLKPGSEAAAAAAAGATNDQLLNILAQQATHIQDKPEGTEAEPMDVDATAEAVEAIQDSANKNLPSLAEILHLNGTEGEKEEEKQDAEKTETEDEEKAETQVGDATETKAAAEPAATQPRPAECKCNCDCGAHGGQKPAVEETTTQPRPAES